jgi:hypothetical protein
MRTMRMAMVAQDEEHEKMAQEMLLMSLGLQGGLFFHLYFIFVLLTNVLGTNYL